MGDLLLGAHASSEGYIFMPMFPGQVDLDGKPTMQTDYEVLEDTLATVAHSVEIPDSLIGFSTPPPTRNVHFKGCNVGRDRFDGTRSPSSPFLVKFKEAFGDHVNVSAPKHFHGISSLDSGEGTFEYMAYEFVVRTKATKIKGGFRGFEKRTHLLAAFGSAGFTYIDGSPVTAADWGKLVPRQITRSRPVEVSPPLGREVAGLKTLNVGREFRVELARYDWTFTPPGGIPAAANRLAALRTHIAADARFQAAHAWPAHERVGFQSVNDFVNGHHWTITVDGTELVSIGRRYDYTVLLPILDRTVTPNTLIFNFYPAPATTHAAITSGFVETDATFFERV